jgi:carboxymethylenebutenolidase
LRWIHKPGDIGGKHRMRLRAGRNGDNRVWSRPSRHHRAQRLVSVDAKVSIDTIVQWLGLRASDVIASPTQERRMSEYINVSTPDGDLRAYLARPSVEPAPAVVVIQEIFGVNADLRDTCDELASQGYLAISPDLFWRMEPNVDMSDQSEADWKKGFALYTAFDIDAGVADIAATMQLARSLTGANGKVGLMGYCLGGLMTFITTARRGADASVVYYGGNTDKHLQEADEINNPLLMHLGENDEYIPKVAQQSIVDALRDKPSARVFIYPGCSHAFARHRGMHYDRDAAELANARTADFLKLHLKQEAVAPVRR